MKAENLTISIPADCAHNCPYCISKLTPAPEENKQVFWRNLPKALELAKRCSVSRVLITSKGEPLNETQMVIDLLIQMAKEITELQTKGIALIQSPEILLRLAAGGLNVLAYSIDHLDQLKRLLKASEYARHFGITVRAAAILTHAGDYASNLVGIVKYCKEMGVDQLTLRMPTVPAGKEYSPQGRWIAEHVEVDWANRIIEPLLFKSHNIVRRLLFDGITIHDIEGLSVCYIPNCLQEFSEDSDIRSLIYHQDGHMYTSWASTGSRIF